MTDTILVCPVCAEPLPRNDRQYVCENNHSFDMARQGYVNLLLPQQKRTKNPGDSPEMIEKRKTFLNQGHYQPMIEALTRFIGEHPLSRDEFAVDCGCGEGYYTHWMQERTDASWYGLDISRPGIVAACQRKANVEWLVASSNKLPFRDGSTKVITSLFSFIAPEEFRRCLATDGTLYAVTPGANHLHQLRAILYDVALPFDETKILSRVSPLFVQTEQRKVAFSITLHSTDDIVNLAKMTPHYWRAKAPAREALLQLDHLTVDAEFCINRLQPVYC